MFLKEEHYTVRDLLRRFTTEYLEMRAPEIDKSGEFPWDVVKKLAEMGIMGITFPPEYGGSGMDNLSYAIAVEEVSRVCGSTGITLAAHISLGCFPIYAFGSEEQKRKYLPPLLSGEKLGGFGLTEPNAGSDAGATETTAVADGNFFILNGTKTFITGAHVAETFVVTAVTEKGAGTKGISAFILEKGMQGFRAGKQEDKLGLRGSDTGELILEDARIPKENLLGKERDGFKQFMVTLDGGRISIGAMALGIAQGALEASIRYSKSRRQFGQAICEFQGIQWILAEMETRVEAARHLVYRAAWLKDRKLRHTKESAMAKLYASETAMWVTTKGIQVHGAYGYIKDYSAERYFRDAKLTEIGEGTSEIQRLIISRELLKK